jgi:hypothetical protein
MQQPPFAHNSLLLDTGDGHQPPFHYNFTHNKFEESQSLHTLSPGDLNAVSPAAHGDQRTLQQLQQKMYEPVQPRHVNNSNRSISQKNRDKVLNGRVVFY